MWQLKNDLLSLQDYKYSDEPPFFKDEVNYPSTFNYQDSLIHYLQLDSVEQLMVSARRANQFNPKNFFNLAIAQYEKAQKHALLTQKRMTNEARLQHVDTSVFTLRIYEDT